MESTYDLNDIEKLIKERDELLATNRHIEAQLTSLNKIIEKRKGKNNSKIDGSSSPEVRLLSKAMPSSEKGMFAYFIT